MSDMKLILEGWRQFVDESLLIESQRGTAFERVVVHVAGGKKTTQDELDFSYGKETFKKLAERALGQLGINPGTDTGAFVYRPQGGIKGDPKTDIVLNPPGMGATKVSLKMPGGVQLVSGGFRTAAATFETVAEELLENLPEVENVEDAARRVILEQTKDLVKKMSDYAGQRWLPQGKTGYFDLIRKKASKAWEKSPRGVKDQFIQRQVNIAEDWVNRQTNIAVESWEEYKREVLVEMNKKLTNLIKDPGLRHALVDEWLTGRRQFKDSPDNVPDILLDPDGFYDIKTMEQTKDVAEKFSEYLKFNIRGKGRPQLSKEPSLRVDFDAPKYYKALIESKSSGSLTEQDESTEAKGIESLIDDFLDVEVELVEVSP